jgi:DNA-binding transcriptional regulator PaaX
MTTLVDVNRVPIYDAILTTLPNYEWPPSATLMCFAIHLGYSETCIRAALSQLVSAGRVERIAEGTVKGKPRYIWRLLPVDSRSLAPN